MALTRTRYFKRYWNESPSGARGDWGSSWWYFETDDAGVVIRQVEIYERGPKLRYSEAHQEDEFGGLSEVALDLTEFAQFGIAAEDFERVWAS